MDKEKQTAKESFIEFITPNLPGVPVKISRQSDREYQEGTRLSPMHFHDEIEIISVKNGILVFELADGSRTVVRSGQTVCVDSRVLHATFSGGGRHQGDMMLQFKNGLFENHEEHGYENYLRSFMAGNRGIMVTDDPELFSTVKNICEEYFSKRRDGCEMYIASYLYSILGFLYRTGFLSDSSAKLDKEKVGRLSPVLEYINDNYQTGITLTKASEILGISKYYFCRLWRSALGDSFIDYLNFVRASKAAKLLRTTGMSILDVALDTGFSSLSYFNRVFKKIHGCSPSVYRKSSKHRLK